MESGLLAAVASLLVAILLRVSGIESSLRRIERKLERHAKHWAGDGIRNDDGSGLDSVDPGEAK